MPYQDKEQRRKVTKAWRDRAVASGYGKALYARRAQRYRNEEVLREGAVHALMFLRVHDMQSAVEALVMALENAPVIGPPSQYMPGGKPDQIASGREGGSGEAGGARPYDREADAS